MSKIVNFFLLLVVAVLLWKIAAKDGPTVLQISGAALKQIAATESGTPKAQPRSVTTPAPTPVIQRSALLNKILSSGDERAAYEAYGQWLQTAEKMEVHATIIRHMDDGHVLVAGFFTDVATRRAASTQTFLVFGLPEAEALADGDIFDCYALMADPMKMPNGTMLREFIRIDYGGRTPPRFERAVYP